jgi:NAD(P)-dependent dehydrogenase (short-subunit alcohol dehydrogenase family)
MATTSNVPVSDEFSGKRVLVTGGTQGAGRAIAERFKQGGATVIVAARSAPKDQSPDYFIEADLSTPEGASKVVREILDRFHGIDIVINNVGGSSAPSGGFITVTDELWQQAMDENLFPAVRLDRGFLPSMIKQGLGVIVHISSIQRRLPLYDSTLAYATAIAVREALFAAKEPDVLLFQQLPTACGFEPFSRPEEERNLLKFFRTLREALAELREPMTTY